MRLPRRIRRSARLAQATLLGRIAQFVIMITAIVIGVDQIGIDITFLSIIAAILLSTTLGAIALAFGLGARRHVENTKFMSGPGPSKNAAGSGKQLAVAAKLPDGRRDDREYPSTQKLNVNDSVFCGRSKSHRQARRP